MNEQQHTARILVFDSGVGGLSVMREIMQRLPSCHYIYASDNGAFPYGTKSEPVLIERVDQVLHRLLQHIEHTEGPVDVIVVACNTASTLTLPHIRSHFTQPIVGVVPAIKPAAAQSHSKVIGLLATPATVARSYTRDLINNFAADCTVISVGSSELVLLAERKLRGEHIALEDINRITAPLREQSQSDALDMLVLACTHFPLLSEELAKCLPARVRMIDSGEAIARRVESLLQTQAIETNAQRSIKRENIALFTKATPEVDTLKPALATFLLTRLAIVAI